MFLFDETGLPPELRAQRVINRARIPEIVRYMVQNPKTYTFSAITASIDSHVHFTPFDEYDPQKRVGILEVPMTARLVINDGQHRKAAIDQAIKLNPELGHETIPVVLFVDAGLKRTQQMFVDLNEHTIRPTRSLGVLYDHRDPLAALVRDLVLRVPLFQERIEKERTTVSHRSTKLFTLSSLYQATRALLGKKNRQESVSKLDSEIAFEFWNELPKHIEEWGSLLEGKLSSAELRRDYVHGHGVGIHAIGAAGKGLIAQYPVYWKSHLSRFHSIDWLRTNTDWNGRAMIGGRLSKAHVNVVLTANYVKQKLGLNLTPEEARIESASSNRKGNGDR